MIESIENAGQISVLCFCVSLTAYRALKSEKKEWTLLFFFFLSRLLGDIYWQVCLIYYGETPQVSIVSDVSWIASYLFMYLLMKMIAGKDGTEEPLIKKVIPWIGPVFTVAMNIFYSQWSNPVTNTVYAVLTGLLMYVAIRGLLNGRGGWLYRLVIFFILLEYAVWTASCFYEPIMEYAYYGFDIVTSITFPFFIPVVQREIVSEG